MSILCAIKTVIFTTYSFKKWFKACNWLDMKQIYLISSPLKIPQKSRWSLFHFKGYYLGDKIMEIAVCTESYEFKMGEEYLMKLEVLGLKGARLITHLLEAKNINDLYVNF